MNTTLTELPQITSLKQLIDYLPHCDKEDYFHLAKHLELSAHELAPYSFWNQRHYTRNCITKTQDYELLLLCWEPGQITAIHDHASEECWVYAIQGLISEEMYEDTLGGPRLLSRSEIQAGQVSYMNDQRGYHRLANSGIERAITLHLYAAPISECQVYDEQLGAFAQMKVSYTSISGIEL